MPLAPLLGRLSGAWAWRTPAMRSKRLHAFALAEHNTLVEMEQAAAATPDAARAAAYLRHAADEARHARMLANRSRELAKEAGRPPPPVVRADSSALFDTLGEVRFLAFVARGEGRAVQQFTGLAASLERRDARTAAILRALLPDEERHHRTAEELLAEVGQDGISGARRRVAWGEVWTAWRRLTAAQARGMYSVVMAVLYPTLAPLALWTRWVRPPRPGFRP